MSEAAGHPPPPAAPALRASVVIPVRGGLGPLATTLLSLAAQDLPGSAFEVIVVDDGTAAEQGHVESIARAAVGAKLRLRVLRQEPAGPAAARNRGIAAACAPVVALLDADVLPRADWLRRGLEPLEGPAPPAAVEGQTVVEPAGERTPFTHQTDNRDGGRFPTCNLLIDRRWLKERGIRFDERYTVPFREDSDFAFQILASGGEIRWHPAAEVVHPPVGRGWTTALRLAGRYEMDGLLKRRFPDAYKRLDRRARMPHLRQRFYLVLAVFQLLLLCTLLGPVGSSRQPEALPLVLCVTSLFWFNVVVALAGGCPTRRALRHLPATALVALIVPWPWLAARVRGWWHFLGVEPFRPPER